MVMLVAGVAVDSSGLPAKAAAAVGSWPVQPASSRADSRATGSAGKRGLVRIGGVMSAVRSGDLGDGPRPGVPAHDGARQEASTPSPRRRNDKHIVTFVW